MASAESLQGDDGGDGVARLQALKVELDLAADDLFGGGGLSAAVGEVGCGDLLEVVDVVDEAALDLVHARIDVAGDGDVDEEHGAVAAALQELLAVGAGEDGLLGAGGGDDDVCARGLVVEEVEGDDLGGAGEARAVDCMGPLASCMEIWPAIWPASCAARSGVRLATRMEVAPCWMRWRAARSDILPAPTSRTVLPCRLPKILRARSTATDAMETEELPIWVSVRTRLATEKARCRSGSSAVETAPAWRATV